MLYLALFAKKCKPQIHFRQPKTLTNCCMHYLLSTAPMSIVFYHLFFRTLTFLYLPVHNFWLLVCPNALSYDWQMGSIPLVHSFQDPRAALALPAFYGTLLLAAMSILYQRYGSKSAVMRDVSKQNDPMVGLCVNKKIFQKSLIL